jgi:DNA repair protein RadD
MELRHYQIESVDALLAYWQSENGNALIDLPTGTGKSVVIAQIIKIVAEHPGAKIVIATHVRELVQQNYDEFIGMYPEFEPVTGINSASLKHRDVDKQITFCSIQSIYKSARDFFSIDVILVDEAHLMPRNDQTMYRKFLTAALAANPDCRLVGLTATPYRLDSGRLDEGDDKVFDKVVYTYNVAKAIEDGYLSPVTTKATKTQFDLSGVGTRGGEFIAGELERAVDKETVNNAVVNEIIAQGADRKSWIVFCSGVSHANHIAELIREAGFSVGVILGDTPS